MTDVHKLYSWADGFHAKVDAEIAGPYIEDLTRQLGQEITAEDLLHEAFDEESPIHDAFEWDDGAAAHEYRLEQARGLIRCIRVTTQAFEARPPRRLMVHIRRDKTAEEHAQFERAPWNTKRVYMPAELALVEGPSREYLVNEAMKALKTWRTKHQDLPGPDGYKIRRLRKPRQNMIYLRGE